MLVQDLFPLVLVYVLVWDSTVSVAELGYLRRFDICSFLFRALCSLWRLLIVGIATTETFEKTATIVIHLVVFLWHLSNHSEIDIKSTHLLFHWAIAVDWIESEFAGVYVGGFSIRFDSW